MYNFTVMANFNEADLRNAYSEVQTEQDKNFEKSLCRLVEIGDRVAMSYPNSGPISRFKQRRALKEASRAFEQTSHVKDIVNKVFPLEVARQSRSYLIGDNNQTLLLGLFGYTELNGTTVTGASKKILQQEYMPAIKLIEGRAEELSQKKVAEDITKLTI